MSVEIVISIAAAIVIFLIFTWSLKVIKASITTLLAIAGILILLQVVFDVNSEQILQEIIQIVNKVISR